MAIFRPTTWKVSVQKALLCPFHYKIGHRHLVYCPGDWKISPKFRKSNRSLSKSRCASGGLGYFFSIKVKWAIFRPRSWTVSVQKVLLSPFHCKHRPSRVSLEFLGLENIPQVPEYRPEVGQNHDARTPVSATL